MLDDIPGNFLAFWVATERQAREAAIVGMSGLEAVKEGAPDLMDVPVPNFVRSPLFTARIAAVRVAPERQRRGIGRALTETVVAWARSHGYKRLILDTTKQQEAAISLYESMGFRRVGQTRFKRWAVLWFELIL